MLDRIDIQIEVTPANFEQLSDQRKSEPSELIRKRVMQARDIQEQRFVEKPHIYSNAMMSPTMSRDICRIDGAGQTLMKTAMNKLQLSARAYDRILKVARTIVDLSGSDTIQLEHLAEAIQYRSLDRESWGGG